MSDTYYVYALKDPKSSPALPFYIGKGTGTRAYDHLVRPDQTRKGLRIRAVHADGAKVLVTTLVDSVSEAQAMRLEAELIAAFGTEDTGGLLTNSVLPSGLAQKARPSLVVPQGAREKAQLGLALLTVSKRYSSLRRRTQMALVIPMPLVCSVCEATTEVVLRTISRTAYLAFLCARENLRVAAAQRNMWLKLAKGPGVKFEPQH